MGEISNSNYYVDIYAMSELETKYNIVIDTLTELYFNLETEVINIETEEQCKLYRWYLRVSFNYELINFKHTFKYI